MDVFKSSVWRNKLLWLVFNVPGNFLLLTLEASVAPPSDVLVDRRPGISFPYHLVGDLSTAMGRQVKHIKYTLA